MDVLRKSYRLELTLLVVILISSLSEAQTSRSAASYFNRGKARLFAGELEEAIQDFSIAISFEPNLAVAYNSRGNAHFAKGSFD